MTCSVEDILAAKMKAAKRGSIVHDAWSKFGDHYFALFATYITQCETITGGVMATNTKPIISLLSVSTLHTSVKEGEGEDDLEDDSEDDKGDVMGHGSL